MGRRWNLFAGGPALAQAQAGFDVELTRCFFCAVHKLTFPKPLIPLFLVPYRSEIRLATGLLRLVAYVFGVLHARFFPD